MLNGTKNFKKLIKWNFSIAPFSTECTYRMLNGTKNFKKLRRHIEWNDNIFLDVTPTVNCP
jgi:hypothetical protein